MISSLSQPIEVKSHHFKPTLLFDFKWSNHPNKSLFYERKIIKRMKSDIVLSEGNSILNIKLKFSFYWKMLHFLRKLTYQIILWKKHYQTREIEKRFCFLWKQFYWKEILSLAGEHSGKPPSSCFSFTFLNFFFMKTLLGWFLVYL